jgi:hypothetical protein
VLPKKQKKKVCWDSTRAEQLYRGFFSQNIKRQMNKLLCPRQKNNSWGKLTGQKPGREMQRMRCGKDFESFLYLPRF